MDPGDGACVAGGTACWDSPSQPEEPASKRRATVKGQVQSRYLDRVESTSLRAMLPPVGGTDLVLAAVRATALLAASDERESVADHSTGFGVEDYFCWTGH